MLYKSKHSSVIWYETCTNTLYIIIHYLSACLFICLSRKASKPIFTGFIQLLYYLVNKIVIVIGFNFTNVFHILSNEPQLLC